MHCGSSTPSRTEFPIASEWKLEPKNLKTYPHFDAVISTHSAEKLAKGDLSVQQHKFYPFLRFNQRWTKFAKVGLKGSVKKRPIRYASRADAYIFAYYRYELSTRYELELYRLDLSDCVLAYRRIIGSDGKGKSNINHAHDAIRTIKSFENCFAITLDVSSFFESLDHRRLKELWCRLLNNPRLPAAHFQVFKAITSYAVVDKLDVYERLGHYGTIGFSPSGAAIKGYLTSRESIPQQLCSGKEFREKIAGGNGQPSLIKKNFKPYGIPQGAPISDLLANLYLLDFDHEINALVKDLGGKYMRYSDDILVIAPCDWQTAHELEAKIRKIITSYGSKIRIKESKSSIFKFTTTSKGQSCERIHGTTCRNGFEYLGFRYDGRFVYLRDSTLSNLRRKMSRVARAAAISHTLRYPDKDSGTLQAIFNHNSLLCRFRKVENFYEKRNDPKHWTFWTYAQKASNIFGDLGRPILKQLKNHRQLLQNWTNDEIVAAVKRRSVRP